MISANIRREKIYEPSITEFIKTQKYDISEFLTDQRFN